LRKQKEEKQDEIYKYQDIAAYYQAYISIYIRIGMGEDQH